MKVTLVHGSDYGGGAETVVRLHHQELIRQGHDSELLLGRYSGKTEHAKQIQYVRGPIGFRRLAKWIESKTGWQNTYSPSFRALEDNFQGQVSLTCCIFTVCTALRTTLNSLFFQSYPSRIQSSLACTTCG